MREKTLWGIIVLLFVTSVVSCGGCSVGLKQVDRDRLDMLNSTLSGSREDIQGLTAAIQVLNENLEKHKDIESTLDRVASGEERIADELKLLNDKLDSALKIKKFLSP